jgi:hypothetical protein
MFNNEGSEVQPFCKACRVEGVTSSAPDPIASVAPISSLDLFATPPSHGPASSQFLTPDSIEQSQRVSYGRAARGRPNPGAAERQRQANVDAFQVKDPKLDLHSESWQDDPALTDRDWQLLQDFHTKLNGEGLETCTRCQERWFRMGLNDDIVCSSCIKADKDKDEDMPFLYSIENNLDPGMMPEGLEPMTQIEEMLIARVHCHVEVRQVRGVQYKYKGHVVSFLTNTAKVYNRLPLLPQDLDIILIRPVNWNKDPRMQRQFRKDTRVRKKVVKDWLKFLQLYHPAYLNIQIAHDNLDALPDDLFVDDELIVHEVEAETEIDATAIGPDEEEEEPEVGAVPDLHPERNEIDIISSQLQSQGALRRATIGKQPRRLPSMSMPTLNKTPLSEFNKSHALLS